MNKQRPDMRGIAGAIAFIISGILAIYYSQEFSPLGAVFPRTISTAMIVLCLVYIIASMIQRKPQAAPQPGSAPRRMLLALTMLAWALLLEPLGFLSTSIICYAAILGIANYDRWTPRSAVIYTAIGTAVIGALYGTFRFALQVPFPSGILL